MTRASPPGWRQGHPAIESVSRSAPEVSSSGVWTLGRGKRHTPALTSSRLLRGRAMGSIRPQRKTRERWLGRESPRSAPWWH